MSARAPMAALVVTCVVAGCAGPQERVILLPSADGAPSAVVISSAKGKTVLDTPYAQGRIASGGSVRASTSSAAEVAAGFAPVLAALPPRPKSYALYFEGDSTEFTAESAALAQTVLTEIAAYAFADVIVIGHTDRSGEADYNDALSLQRATVVRERLIDQGLDPARVAIAGRGEREPLVPTADGVVEPRNRRAELSVR
jgi:outer membrane protein OmpA-like peptidoglycan-associated protein